MFLELEHSTSPTYYPDEGGGVNDDQGSGLQTQNEHWTLDFP